MAKARRQPGRHRDWLAPSTRPHGLQQGFSSRTREGRCVVRPVRASSEALGERWPHPSRTASRAVGIETASSTTILDELERLGSVRRVRNPKDRRKINVYLTDAGSALQPILLERPAR